MIRGVAIAIVLFSCVFCLEISVCPASSELGDISYNLTSVDCTQSLRILEANRIRSVEKVLLEFVSVETYFNNHSTCIQQNGEVKQEVPLETINQNFVDSHLRMKIAEYCFEELREWIGEIMRRTNYFNYQDVACSGRTRLVSYVNGHHCSNWRIMED